jgi:predicted nucleotidyltransferase
MAPPPVQDRISIDRSLLAAFCRRWKIVELCLFGSAVTEHFAAESDIDTLVSFARDTGPHFHGCWLPPKTA